VGLEKVDVTSDDDVGGLVGSNRGEQSQILIMTQTLLGVQRLKGRAEKTAQMIIQMCVL
jgi:hypothetical protein